MPFHSRPSRRPSFRCASWSLSGGTANTSTVKYFTEDVVAFRANRPDGRHDAVRALQKRAEDPADCYAGEMDICAFFDEIPHSVVLSALQAADQACGSEIHPLAIHWVKAYLASVNQKKGLPQGGALSPLLCNLALREADTAVRTACPSSDTVYFRYCDDMILLTSSPEESACGLQVFQDALDRIGLKPHASVHANSLTEAEFLQQKSQQTPQAHPVPIHRASILLKTYFIHKSAGRDPRGGNPKLHPHWGGGFRLLDFNDETRIQLRQLDREMSRRFAILQTLEPEPDLLILNAPARSYFGAPFSYYERFRDPYHLRPCLRKSSWESILGTCNINDFFCEEPGLVSG